MIDSFFKQAFSFRVENNSSYSIYREKNNKLIDIENIKKINKKQLIEMVDIKNIDFYVSFWFEKIVLWIKKNEKYTYKFINDLESIIKKLQLKNKIGSYEQEYINHIKAVVFMKKRNLKKLIVDFPLESFDSKKIGFFNKKVNELVFYNFSKCDFLNEKNKKILNESELYISNHRLIFSGHYQVFSIYFNQINNYKLINHKLVIWIKNNNNQLTINSYDNYVLFVSIERMMNYWKKNYF